MDSTGREIIAIGKGLGFGQLPREITLSEIERTFYNIDLIGQNVMRDLPIEIVMFTAKILDIAANELPYELSPNAALLMADHISFAIERTKKRLRVKMPLSYDVRQMYPVEYKIGQYTVAKIRKEFHISLEREEIAGIAMNLVNAKVAPDAETEQGEVEQFEMMLEDITEIVETDFHIIINRESFQFSRYATHLHYLFQRIHDCKAIDSDNLQIYRGLREEFSAISDCVDHISQHIEQKWHTALSEEEKLYLILHINRICVKEGL